VKNGEVLGDNCSLNVGENKLISCAIYECNEC
jgi:hypothetical protein